MNKQIKVKVGDFVRIQKQNGMYKPVYSQGIVNNVIYGKGITLTYCENSDGTSDSVFNKLPVPILVIPFSEIVEINGKAIIA